MKTGPNILCIGAAHWDLIARAGAALCVGDDVPGVIQRRPGGVALNIAKGVAAYDLSVGLCSVVGDDDTGISLIRDLDGSGVDCAGVIKAAGMTTDHYIAIEDDHGGLFAAIADSSLLEQYADAVMAHAKSTTRQTKTIFLDANLPEVALRDIAENARETGVEIVVNPVSPSKALRLGFLLSGDFAPTIVANLAEANALLGADHAEAEGAASALRTRSGGAVLVTAGAQPSTLATQTDIVLASPPDLSGATSVTGAGDALLAAFLAAPDRQVKPSAALEFALNAAAEHMRLKT